MEPVIKELLQFGLGGLIFLMWIYERNERQSKDEHLKKSVETTIQAQKQLDVMMTIVQNNTTAMTRIDTSIENLKDIIKERTDDKAS